MLSLPWHCPRAPDPHAHLNRKAVVRPCCFCYFGREGVVVGLARATLPICAGTPCRSVRRTQISLLRTDAQTAADLHTQYVLIKDVRLIIRDAAATQRYTPFVYLRVSTNGYADTGASKPFVHLGVGPPLYLALRRSRDGGRGKRARSGCWFNAEWGRLCDSGKDGVQGGEGGWRKWRNLKWDDQEEVGRSQEGNEHILGISRCAEIVIGWECEMPTQSIGSARSLGMRGAFFCSLLHMVSYFP
ncbi:hypothetical protein C8R47DRAFT_336935 [Mycena vitilis]|nr:hypothetical protein C8R47DRAFT_336935 [Mycena vitilis]